jgi:hypothetical protein
MTTDNEIPESAAPGEETPAGGAGDVEPPPTASVFGAAAPPAPDPAGPATQEASTVTATAVQGQHDVDDDSSDGAPGADDGSPENSQRRKRTVIVAGLVVIAVGVVLIAVNSLGSSNSASKNSAAPTDATTAFLAALQKDDLPAAFEELCAPFRSGTPEGVLKPGAVDPLAEAGGLKSFTVDEATITDEDGTSTAVTTYELVVGDDQKRAGRAELVLEDGEWKVCSFSV